MRIALFTDTFVPSMNGVARVLGLLVEHAVREGHEVGVVGPALEDRAWPGTAFHIRVPGVPLPFYREFHACRPWMSGRDRQELARFRPDVVHTATEALVGIAGRRWALRNGIPFVSSYCTSLPHYVAGYGFGFLRGAVWAHLRRFHRPARISLCPSEATRRELQEHGFHGRFRIWSRGVDSELFHPRRRSEDLRRRMAPDAEVVLLYAGRMAPEKRLDLLMDALPEIRIRTGRKVALVFVGGGPEVARLRKREMEGVHFAGYRRGEDLAAHYASADLFLFPSDTETFGQVVTEAQSSGLPVVAPARGGVTETIVHGTSGLLFEPGDVDDLVRKALTLIRDPGLAARLGAEGRRSAESRSWSRVFRRLFGDYREAGAMGDTPVMIPPEEPHPV